MENKPVITNSQPLYTNMTTTQSQPIVLQKSPKTFQIFFSIIIFFLLVVTGLLAYDNYQLKIRIADTEKQLSEVTQLLTPTTQEVSEEVISPTTLLTPTSTLSTAKEEPKKIVESMRKLMNINLNTPIEASKFEWRNNTNDENSCANEPVNITGVGFTVKNLNSFQVPDLNTLGFGEVKGSSCNTGDGTLKGQSGYIIGQSVCLLNSEIVKGLTTVTFSCGSN